MRSVRRLLVVLLAVCALLVLSLLSSFFGPGRGPDPDPEDSPSGATTPTADGRVLGAGGGPAPAGTTVAAIGPGLRVEAEVDGDGSFSFGGDPEGATGIEIVAGSLRIRRPFGSPPREIRLPDRVDVAGRVVAEDTGEPLAGATVRAGESADTTGERGAFRLPGVPVADARLPEIRIEAEGFETLVVPTDEARAWDDLFLRLVRR
jgi:hypothetical protein